MEIREARSSDFEFITRLIQSKSELFWVYPRGRYPLTVTQLQLLSEERCDLTVATEAGAVVGFANLYNLERGHSVFIGNVVVDQRLRGQGIGKALVAHMVNLALDKYGVQQVSISVFSDNIPALLMYARLGFRPNAVEERRDWEGRRVALLHMVMHKDEWQRSSAGAMPR